MRRVHLIREFAPDAYEFALSSWSWIGIGDKTPRFASCFGDMFLESLDGWWFLDTVEGTLERRWNTLDVMFAELQEPDARAEYLLEETLTSALAQGLRLGDDEVFAFLPPPAVTGTMSVDSLAPLRFAIAANLAGRIHGELNGVQPDAGASALFAAQRAARPAAPGPVAPDWAPQPDADLQAGWVPQPEPVSRAGWAPQPGWAPHPVAGAAAATREPGFDVPNPQTDRWEPSAQRVETGTYPAVRQTSEPAHSGHLDASHTLDSGQFSQYIADQYNTGQVAAVQGAAIQGAAVQGAAVRQAPAQWYQGGRRSYA